MNNQRVDNASSIGDRRPRAARATHAALAAVLITCLSANAWGKLGSRVGKLIGDTADVVGDTVSDVGDAGAEMLEGPPVEEQRAELQTARENALDKLWVQDPSLKKVMEDSRGYAVFSNMGINLFLVSTQRGGGILRDNRSSEDIYMKMFSAGGGLGLGVKNFAAIFIFHTDAAIDQFATQGWDFSAQADAGAQHKDDGDGVNTAVSAMPGTSLYQLTDSGLAAQVTLQGTKFWKDEELNAEEGN